MLPFIGKTGKTADRGTFLDRSSKPRTQARRETTTAAGSRGASARRLGMVRFGFSIKTRSGQRVDHIMIMAATQADAERRLRQMYHHCEIVSCNVHAVPRRVDTLDVEEVIGMISGSEPAVVRLRQ
jgi:hypothetical protein